MKPKFEIGQTVYYISYINEMPQVLSRVIDGHLMCKTIGDEVFNGYTVDGMYVEGIEWDGYADRNEAGRELIKLLEERLVKVVASIAPLKETIAAAKMLYNVEDD